MKYSSTTVFMPELDLKGQCQLLNKLGFDGIELRVRYCTDEQRQAAVPSNWGYHVNDITPDNFLEKAPEISAVTQDYGLQIPCLATNFRCDEQEVFKKVLEGAVVLNVPLIRVGATLGFTANGTRNYKAILHETVANFAKCVELAKGTGIRLVVEMHGNTIHPSASLAMQIAGAFSPSQTGVIYDPQNMVRDGYETPAIAIQMLGEYLAHCHFGAHRPVQGETNANGTVVWKWEGCRPAEGLFDFHLALHLLKQANFQGFITVEDFRTNATAEEKLADAIAYYKKLEEIPYPFS